MPEYLAPGVYVEEVETGSKPIEGVSTNTAGMVGVTERGPVNVPILVTSVGDYARSFGGRLDFGEFTYDGRCHAYLPYAVEGFFTNGGKRAFVTRVLPEDAQTARRTMFEPGVVGGGETVLLATAHDNTGTAPNELVVIDDTGLDNGNWIRIGDGSRAEYRRIDGATSDASHVGLNFSLNETHPSGTTLDELPATPQLTLHLLNAVGPGNDHVTVSGTGPDIMTLSGIDPAVIPTVIQVGTSTVAEHRRVTLIDADTTTNSAVLTLAHPLSRRYFDEDEVIVLDLTVAALNSDTLRRDASAGELIVYRTTSPVAGAFDTATNLIVVDLAGTPEVCRIGALNELVIAPETYTNYPAGTIIEVVNIDREIIVSNVQGGSVAHSARLNDLSDIEAGMLLSFGGTDTAMEVDFIDPATNIVTFTTTFNDPHNVGDPIIMPLFPAVSLSTDSDPGDVVIYLNNRVGLNVGNVLILGGLEHVTITAINGNQGLPPDAGSVVISRPIRHQYASGITVQPIHRPAAVATSQLGMLVLGVGENNPAFIVNDANGFVAPSLIRVRLANGDLYHTLSAINSIQPSYVGVDTTLTRIHEVGMTVAERRPLFDVVALDPGGWGNRLLVSAEAEEGNGLASQAEVTDMTLSPDPTLPSSIRVSTVTGIESGTVLELLDPNTGDVIDQPVKVRRVDQSANNLVELDAGTLQTAHMTAFSLLPLGQRLLVRSHEFHVAVYLRRQPDRAVPSRNDTVIDFEVIRHLSMDPRHSRYIHKVIGTTWHVDDSIDLDGNPLRRSDRRSDGESQYIRVRDLNATEDIRWGPEPLIVSITTLFNGFLFIFNHNN